MVELKPNGLKLAQFRVVEVGDRFYFFTVEVIFHNVVEHFILSVTIPFNKQLQQPLKSLILYFSQLQKFSTIFQHSQSLLQMHLHYFLPT